MIEDFKQIETKPYLVAVNQLEVPPGKPEVSKAELENISQALQTWSTNFSLPIACLTDQDNSYRLLTGLPIYQAAVNAGMQRIWVFLISADQRDTEKAIEQALLQSKLNQIILDSQDMTNFINFLNDHKSDLTQIYGIGDNYAKQIISKRPYKDLKDLQKKHGNKRPLNWAKGYKKMKTEI